MRQLEGDLGAELLTRTSAGTELTAAGELLLAEARALLDHADRVRARVRNEAGPASIVVGSLADTADLVGSRLVTAFRERHPQVSVTIHEFDLGDPTAGLRAGRVDLALTRMPFSRNGLRTQVLARQKVSIVIGDGDPLASATTLSMAELSGRPWVRLPEGTDPEWLAYWTAGVPEGPVVRTIQECLQAVLWNGRTALAPLDQVLPPGLVAVPVSDRPPSELVLAWRAADTDPVIRSFVASATQSFSRCRPG
jgi:DNA-binding transcriptional LysR family regulator